MLLLCQMPIIKKLIDYQGAKINENVNIYQFEN